jgi:cell division transport system permease protein
MALKLDYVVRETSTNIRRNVTLTIAAIVTMGVSLSLFGSAMLMRAGVANLSTRWEHDVQLIVFLARDITDEQKDALEQAFDDNPEAVSDWFFMNQEESNEEFQRLFRRNQAMLERSEENPELVPTSYRITPRTSNEDAIRQMAEQFGQMDGVIRTTSALDSVRMVRQVSNSAQKAIFVIAVGLLLAALLLILNAIRMAIFARRREIEVMKLVGATNWFIRVPFMLEGVVQGVIGSTFAVVSVFFLDRFMERYGTDPTNILSGFVASSSEAFFVMVMVVVIGIVIGAAGSGWAVSRFLKV